jgi:hypothetical protein
VLLTKPLSPLVEYCKVAPTSKLLIVITPLLVMPSVTYRIKGTNANKFLITTDTGILTYKTIQTSVHNDTVIIVATDIAGNETERSITVSVKILAQGFVINGENADDSN